MQHHPASPRTPLGQRMYAEGRALVASGVATPAGVMFDCDEVLWDWVMDMGRILRRVPLRARRRDLMGHREFFVAKPGLFEMLWGMRHEAAERGLSADIRLWTNGYPWRLWCIARELPGFAELVGLSPDATPEDWDAHPNIFSRVDYTRAIFATSPARIAAMPEAARSVLLEHLEKNPTDSTLKLPELAPLIGKQGFTEVGVLVDDHGRNIKRFIASNRRGVRVRSHPPRIIRGRIPNTVWRGATRVVQALSNTIAEPIAVALRELAVEAPPASRTVEPVAALEAADRATTFHVDIPGALIRDEWLEPMRRLERAIASGHRPWRSG